MLKTFTKFCLIKTFTKCCLIAELFMVYAKYRVFNSHIFCLDTIIFSLDYSYGLKLQQTKNSLDLQFKYHNPDKNNIIEQNIILSRHRIIWSNSNIQFCMFGILSLQCIIKFSYIPINFLCPYLLFSYAT